MPIFPFLLVLIVEIFANYKYFVYRPITQGDCNHIIEIANSEYFRSTDICWKGIDVFEKYECDYSTATKILQYSEASCTGIPTEIYVQDGCFYDPTEQAYFQARCVDSVPQNRVIMKYYRDDSTCSDPEKKVDEFVMFDANSCHENDPGSYELGCESQNDKVAFVPYTELQCVGAPQTIQYDYGVADCRDVGDGDFMLLFCNYYPNECGGSYTVDDPNCYTCSQTCSDKCSRPLDGYTYQDFDICCPSPRVGMCEDQFGCKQMISEREACSTSGTRSARILFYVLFFVVFMLYICLYSYNKF